MKRFGRLAAVTGCFALVGAMTISPASADHAEVFVGSASGRALALTVAGQTVSLGTSTSKVSSDLKAVVDAAGQLAVVGNNVAPAHAEAVGDGNTSDAPRTCAPVALPAPVASIVDVGVACSEGTASVRNGAPVAIGSGAVDRLGLSANTVISQVLSALPVQSLADTLKPITGALPQGAQTTLDALVTSVLKTKTLDVTLGATDTSVVTDTNKVVSTATSAGAVIKLLPTPQVNQAVSLDPIATITVGPAKAVAQYERAAGKATPTVDAALVRVNLNPVVAQGLGVPAEVAVPVDQDFSVPGLAGTPLETHIKVAHGTTSVDPDGTVKAVADAVSIELAQGVSGGVSLQLANATASVQGAPAVATPAAPAQTPSAPGALPHTGPTRPWLPIAGAGALTLALVAWRPMRRLLSARVD